MMTLDVVWLGLCVFVTALCGSTIQRVSGMGFALLSGPVFSLLMGPIEGIIVVNVLAAANAVLLTYAMRRDVDWARCALIGSVMVVGSVPAVWLLHIFSTNILQIIVGASLLFALCIVVFLHRYIPRVRGWFPAVLAGVAGGFMNTLAGVTGPVLTVYAQASRWEHRFFAATLQPLFLVSAVVSFVLKSVFGVGSISDIPWVVWAAGGGGMVCALGVGRWAAGRVARRWGRIFAICVAAVGALAVLVRGLLIG